MKKEFLLAAILFVLAGKVFTQSKFLKSEISVNGFRNPSIGLEVRYRHLSLHGGYYLTNFTSGVTTRFIKSGLTYWLLPVDNKPIPSSFYLGAAYLRGLNRNYKNMDALGMEAGFRWMAWKGLNLRIGAIALTAKGQPLRINPTPGISYSFTF